MPTPGWGGGGADAMGWVHILLGEKPIETPDLNSVVDPNKLNLDPGFGLLVYL